MRRLAALLLGATLISASQPVQTPMTTPQTQPQGPPAGKELKKEVRPARPAYIPPAKEIQIPSEGSLSVYTHPGVIMLEGSKWNGSDHLLNVSKDIYVSVEILKPEGTKLPFDKGDLEKRINASFKANNFNSDTSSEEATANSSTPGLPFFNLLLVVYPIEQGYVGLIEGRLFETVDPLRVKLDKETYFQAVTWEKKTLIVAPTEEFQTLVEKTVDEITNIFFQRFEYFDKIKLKMESKKPTSRME